MENMCIASSGQNPFDNIFESDRGMAPTEMQEIKKLLNFCTENKSLFVFLCHSCKIQCEDFEDAMH